MQGNKEKILETLNEKEFEKFQEDLSKLSRNQEVLSDEDIEKEKARLSKMTEEEILDELQSMFIAKRKPFERKIPKIGRNEPCPCGSGIKYKKCCKTEFEFYLKMRQADIGDVE